MNKDTTTALVLAGVGVLCGALKVYNDGSIKRASKKENELKNALTLYPDFKHDKKGGVKLPRKAFMKGYVSVKKPLRG